MAARVVESSRSYLSPTMKSCPIRWDSVISERMVSAHVAASATVGGAVAGATEAREPAARAATSATTGPRIDSRRPIAIAHLFQERVSVDPTPYRRAAASDRSSEIRAGRTALISH